MNILELNYVTETSPYYMYYYIDHEGRTIMIERFVREPMFSIYRFKTLFPHGLQSIGTNVDYDKYEGDALSAQIILNNLLVESQR